LHPNSIEFIGVYSDGREPVDRAMDLVSIQLTTSDSTSRPQATFPANCNPEPSGEIGRFLRAITQSGRRV
jgi:hypothetical protein